jgi:hypothetical protein
VEADSHLIQCLVYVEIVKSLVEIFCSSLVRPCLNISMLPFVVHLLPESARSSLSLQECPSIL